jgi:hypothetical protein
MAPWIYQNITWLKFLANVWDNDPGGDLPVAGSMTSGDGLSELSSPEDALSWVGKGKRHCLALPWGIRDEDGNNKLVIAHHLVALDLTQSIHGLIGFGMQVREIRLDAGCLGNKDFWNFGDDFLQVKVPTFAAMVNWPLEAGNEPLKSVRSLRGKSSSRLVETIVQTLRPALTLTPHLLEKTLEWQKINPRHTHTVFNVVDLMMALAQDIRERIVSKNISKAKAQDLYGGHMTTLWLMAQDEFDSDPLVEDVARDFGGSLNLPQLARVEQEKEEWDESGEGLAPSPKPVAREEDTYFDASERGSEDGTAEETIHRPEEDVQERAGSQRKGPNKRPKTVDFAGFDPDDSDPSDGPEGSGSGATEESTDDDESIVVDFDSVFNTDGLSAKEKAQMRIQKEDMRLKVAALNHQKKSNKLSKKQAKSLEETARSMKQQMREEGRRDRKKKLEKSVMKKWPQPQQAVLHRLSSKGFIERSNPLLTDIASTAFAKEKNFSLVLENLKHESEQWLFCVIPSAFAGIMTTGFYNRNIRSDPLKGFSVFHFAPEDFLKEMDSKEGRKWLIGQALASEELPEAAINDLARTEFYHPRHDDLDGAIKMLKTAVAFLEYFFGEGSIAPDVHNGFLRWTEKNYKLMAQTIKEDPGDDFLIRFLHLADRTFAAFCEVLLEEPINSVDPMGPASVKLKDFAERFMRKELGNMMHGGAPGNLPRPNTITEALTAGKRHGQGKKQPVREVPGAKVPKEDRQQQPDKFQKNPDPVPPAWKLPRGKKYAEVLGRDAPKEHSEFWPLCRHHVFDAKRKLCGRFVLGECHYGKKCQLAHIPNKQLSPEEYKAIDDHLPKIIAKLK